MEITKPHSDSDDQVWDQPKDRRSHRVWIEWSGANVPLASIGEAVLRLSEELLQRIRWSSSIMFLPFRFPAKIPGSGATIVNL